MKKESIVMNQQAMNQKAKNRKQPGSKIIRRASLLSYLSVIILALAVILSACGNQSEQSSQGQNSQAAANVSASAATGNAGDAGNSSTQGQSQDDNARTVKHAMESTELKGTPERVVVLTQEGTEALLALGVTPVGAVNSGLGDRWFPHIAAEMEGVTELGEESQPNVELIVSLQPDLIIGNKVRHEKIYNQLKEIAPTVFSEDLAGQWKVNFALYAEAVNKHTEWEQVMADYDNHIADAKAKLGDKISSEVSLVRFLPDTVRLYQKDTFAGTILQDIGLARPASQDKDQFMEVITKEQMDAMDGDILFYFNSDYDEEKGATKNQQEWMDDPLFKNLNVAKSGKVFQVDEVIWNLSGGIKSANLLIDDLLKRFK